MFSPNRIHLALPAGKARDTLRVAAERQGWQVTASDSVGVDGVSHLAADVLVLDEEVRGARALLDAVREDPTVHRPRIAVVPAPDARRSGGESDWEADAYLPRPVAANALLTVVRLLLRDDVDERAVAHEALRESERRKDEFLAVLSHELRNPLMPIANSLFVLDRVPPGSAQAKRAHAVITRQVGHLARLVDDLLDITRIGRGTIRLHRERMEIGSLLARVNEDHVGAVESAGLAIELDSTSEPLWVDGDPTRIAQIVGNLLQNAIKFSQPGGRIQVTLARAGSSAEIRVRDWGEGIAAPVLDHVFEPFSQADQSIARTRGGLGLGLALVKSLVELHGGDVSAVSEGEGRGAEFTVRLPLCMPASVGSDARGARGGIARRVLVIEDNVDAADSLKVALELQGHEVLVALDGTTGLACAHAEHPDVILCDLGLPDIDGYGVARALRSDDDLRHTTLVALSGYALPEDVRRAAEAGFDRHIAKPPSLDAISTLIASSPARSG